MLCNNAVTIVHHNSINLVVAHTSADLQAIFHVLVSRLSGLFTVFLDVLLGSLGGRYIMAGVGLVQTYAVGQFGPGVWPCMTIETYGPSSPWRQITLLTFTKIKDEG